MIKQFSVFLLFIALASASHATDNSYKVASVEKERPGKNPAALPPVVTEKYKYYEVRGGCEKELHGQLCKNCITWDDGKKYDSATSWNVKWNYDYDRTAQACSADSFKVTVDVLFQFPKWVRMDDAPPALVGKWDAYMRNLSLHENGHRDLVVEAAAGLTRSVASLPPAQTCAELDREVRKLCSARMAQLEADQREYDDQTDHGVTQGAIFP